MAKQHTAFCGFDSHDPYDDEDFDNSNTNNTVHVPSSSSSSENKAAATAASTTSNSGVMVRLLPLHRACELSAPLRVCQTLVDIFPESAKLKDHRNNWLPLHYCAATLSCYETHSHSAHLYNNNNHHPIGGDGTPNSNNNNNNNNNNSTMNILNYILGQYTNAAMQKESLGRLPIHLACENGATKSSLQSLLAAYPDSARCKTKEGQLPLHCACRSTYMHRSVEDEQAFQVLLQAYPESARIKDYSGKTSIDYMNENAHPNKRAILKLLEKSPAQWVSPCATNNGRPVPNYGPQHQSTSTMQQQYNNTTEYMAPETVTQSELYSAVLRQDWERAISLVIRRPADAGVWYTMQDGNHTTWYRSLPIHEACKLNPSFECIKALLLAYNATYEVDSHHCLPIHHVCEHGVSDVRVAKLLLKLNKGSTRTPDHHGMLPLHLAAWGGQISEDVVDLLLKIHAPAIRVRDRRGRTPVQIAQRRNNMRMLNVLVNHHNHNQHHLNQQQQQQHQQHNNTLLTPTSSANLSDPLLSSSLGTFSFASKSTLTTTMTPGGMMTMSSIKSIKTELYKAVSEKRWKDVIRIVMVNPEQANEWKLVQGYDGSILSRLLPIHLACQINPPDEVIAALLEAAPLSVKAQGNASALPLHSACAHGASIGVVEMLLRAYPQSIHCKDAESRIPLDYARDSYHANKGVIIHALERDVTYWKQPNPQAPATVQSVSPDHPVALQQQQQQQQQQGNRGGGGEAGVRTNLNMDMNMHINDTTASNNNDNNTDTNDTNAAATPVSRPPPPPIPMQEDEDENNGQAKANATANNTIASSSTANNNYTMVHNNNNNNTSESSSSAAAAAAVPASLRALEPLSPRSVTNNDDARSHPHPHQHAETVVVHGEHVDVPPTPFTYHHNQDQQQQHTTRYNPHHHPPQQSAAVLAEPYESSSPTMSWGEPARVAVPEKRPSLPNVLLQPQRAVTPASVSYNRQHKQKQKQSKNPTSNSHKSKQSNHHHHHHHAPKKMTGNANSGNNTQYNADVVIAPTESMEKTELFALAEKRNWNALIGRCNERPDEAATWYVVKNAQGQVVSRMLPIHEACRRQPEELAIISLLNAYLDGVKQVDHSQRLPIHFACEHGANVTIVEAIRQYNPFGLAARDGRGMLPIHCCCWGGGSGRVISHLVKIFPKGLDEVDNFGRTPIMIALEGNHLNKIEILDALQPAY